MLTPIPTNRAGELALEIFQQTLSQIPGDRLVQGKVWREGGDLHVDDLILRLSDYRRILVAGAGKASVSMAKGLEEILGDAIAEGLVVTKYHHAEPLAHCKVLESGHPIPDEASLEAGQAMVKFANQTQPDDLVLFCLSGGASALMEAPVDNVSLENLRVVNRTLLDCGMPIQSMNQIRRRLSKIKGGGLLSAFGQATVVGLVMEDIWPSNIDAVGSGPLSLPQWESLESIVGEFKLKDRLEPRIVELILTSKSPTVSSSNHTLRSVGNQNLLRQIFEDAIAGAGLNRHRWFRMNGNGRVFGERWAKKSLQLRPGRAIAGTGECTLEIRGDGLGGRCQEMACIASKIIAGQKNLSILFAGTDGTDGPTDATGALVDGETMARALSAGWSVERALSESNTYRFHEAAGSLIKTGPTGSNLTDICLAIRT